jgi:hypothetical protein
MLRRDVIEASPPHQGGEVFFITRKFAKMNIRTSVKRNRRPFGQHIIPASPGWMVVYDYDGTAMELPIIAWILDGHWSDQRWSGDCRGDLRIYSPEPITIEGNPSGDSWAVKDPNGTYAITPGLGLYATWEECRAALAELTRPTLAPKVEEVGP